MFVVSAISESLSRAKDESRCAEIVLTTGERLLTGVNNVDEKAWCVVVFSPMSFGDNTTVRTIDLNHVVSVVVTDVAW